MKSRLELPTFFKNRWLNGDGVEVGVLFGEFSRCILANWPGRLFMVDPWQQQPASVYLDGCNSVNMDRAYHKAQEAVQEFGDRAVIIRDYSREASALFKDGQLDWAYIDANHSYGAVTADLLWWWPKIRSGGIIAGHDFYERHDDWQDCGVEMAVRDFAKLNGLQINIIPEDVPSWWLQKP